MLWGNDSVAVVLARLCLDKFSEEEQKQVCWGNTLVGDKDGVGGIVFPEHPSPILHAPRDNISRKDNPSLRYT